MKKYYTYGREYKEFDNLSDATNHFMEMDAHIDIYKAIGINTESGSCDIIVSINGYEKMSHDFIAMKISIDKKEWLRALYCIEHGYVA